MNVAPLSIKKGRKFDHVLKGARTVFLADGFEGASVDKIARVSGVSKATLYSYFSDKKSLFIEVVRAECTRQADEAISKIDMAASPETVLRGAAGQLIGFFTSEFGLGVYRICVAETDRFPELGQAFYESGPRVVNETLCGYFDLAIHRNELSVPDTSLAAHQFAELCKSEIFAQIIFGVRKSFDQTEIDRIIDGAVDVFLARYGA